MFYKLDFFSNYRTSQQYCFLTCHHFQGQYIRIYNFMQICNTFIDISNKEFNAVNKIHSSLAKENKCILLKRKKCLFYNLLMFLPTYTLSKLHLVFYLITFHVAEICNLIFKSLAFHIVKGNYKY